MQKEFEVVINARLNDEELQGLEKYLEELQDAEVKIGTDNSEIEELEQQIEEVKAAIEEEENWGIDTSESEAELEELQAKLDELKAAAEEETEVGLNTGGAQEQVDGLKDSLDGFGALAVGDVLQEYGASAENMAQQMNTAQISVGQLATNAGMAEGDMIGLINNISNATFPQSEAMAYVEMLNQMGVGADKLGDSATNIDKINDATGMGYQNAMQLVRGFGALGVRGDNLQSTFNAVAYAQANAVGGAKDMGNILKMQAGTLNEYHVDVDTATVAISDLSHKYGSARKAGAALSKALKDNNGDLKAVEKSLGMQPGALSKASEKTDQYKGKLQKLADEEAEHKTFLDQLGAAWEDLSLSLGGVATPIMGVIGLGGQVAGFGAQLNGTWNLLSKFKNIGGISGAVSSLGGIFGGLTGTLSGAGSALLGLATGPVGIIIAALIALGVAVYEVGKYFGWWTDLPSMFSAITSGVTALWNSFMSNEYVIQAIALIKQGLTDAWNAIVGFGQAIMTSIGGAGGEFDILGFAIQALQTILSVVGPVVVTYIQMMMNNFRAIYTVGQAVWPYLAAIVGGAINGIRGIISGAMAIWSGLQGAWRGLQSTASSVFGAINGVVSSAGGAWHNFQSTVSGVVNGIMDKINALKDAAAGITNLLTGGTSQGGIETVTTGAGGSGGGSYTNVSQGNTIIFNMYGDVRDEKTLDDMINAINSRLEFESLAKGTTNNGGVV